MDLVQILGSRDHDWFKQTAPDGCLFLSINHNMKK
jgi:hypothetical protein